MTATATRRSGGCLLVSTVTLLMGMTSGGAGQRDGANEYYDALHKLPSFWKGYAASHAGGD